VIATPSVVSAIGRIEASMDGPGYEPEPEARDGDRPTLPTVDAGSMPS